MDSPPREAMLGALETAPRTRSRLPAVAGENARIGRRIADPST